MAASTTLALFDVMAHIDVTEPVSTFCKIQLAARNPRGRCDDVKARDPRELSKLVRLRSQTQPQTKYAQHGRMPIIQEHRKQKS